MSKVSSGSLRLSGNAFQTDGLATENARQQSYDVMRVLFCDVQYFVVTTLL